MGKPFQQELGKINDTIRWAERQDVSKLRSFFSVNAGTSLICIGSGGSFSAASYASMLYRKMCGFSVSMTPLAFDTSADTLIQDSKLLFFSASGRNRDFLIAFQRGLEIGRGDMAGVCLRESSKLDAILEKFNPGFQKHTFLIPTIKDGFLATNSLVAFFVLMYRCFFDTKPSQHIGKGNDYTQNHAFDFSAIDNFIVLHSSLSEPVAVDLESKFSEAALGSVLMADYRNFGHGRHQWFDKKGGNSCIVALINDNDRQLAEKTLRIMPEAINVVRIESDLKTPLATIDLLVKSFHFVSSIGDVRGIDPGRPGVPNYGTELYHLNYAKLINNESIENPPKDLAISRKLRLGSKALVPGSEYEAYSKAYDKFFSQLKGKEFNLLALDYDGTICNVDRYSRWNEKLEDSIAKQINKLLGKGIRFAVMTGRGDSLHELLRNSISEEYWSQVYLGCYNGAVIVRLSDDKAAIDAVKNAPQDEQLTKLERELQRYHFQPEKIKKYSTQLSLSCPDKQKAYEICNEIILSNHLDRLHIWSSSHSMDIVVSTKASKTAVKQISEDVLVIGDRGDYVGNDFEMLSLPFSLSVDGVSRDPDSCWNLAPKDLRGIDVVKYYLRKIKATHRGFKIAF
jgi:hydroxymethylpyrimidine pyrophosphatase-like HAD family hydrolase